MARIRTVKPEMWADEALARLPVAARLLFIALLNFADDEGRMRGNPLFVRAQCFPYDDNLDVSDLLNQLADGGFLQQYEQDGQGYLWVRSFTKHQKIDHPSPSTLPAPPDELRPREASTKAREDSPKARAGREGNGKDRNGEEEIASPVPPEPARPPSAFTGYLKGAFPTCKRPENLEVRAKEAWPGVDLLAEAKKARAWEESNPTRIKGNKAAFLVRWFNRAQEQGGGYRNGNVVSFDDSAAKARAEESAAKRSEETRLLLEKQKAEKFAATPPDEAKKRLDMLKSTVLANMGSK